MTTKNSLLMPFKHMLCLASSVHHGMRRGWSRPESDLLGREPGRIQVSLKRDGAVIIPLILEIYGTGLSTCYDYRGGHF